MALVLPPSMSPPTFNRCMREKQTVATRTRRARTSLRIGRSLIISGASESPFMFARGGTFYLSICAASLEYNRTWVFASALLVGVGM